MGWRIAPCLSLFMAKHTGPQGYPNSWSMLPKALHSIPQSMTLAPGDSSGLTIQPVQWGLLCLQWPLVQVPPNIREAPKLVACGRVQSTIWAGQAPSAWCCSPGIAPKATSIPMPQVEKEEENQDLAC